MDTMEKDREIVDVELSQIVFSNFNPRTSFPEEEMREFSLGISEKGVLQAILLRPKGKKYEIVFGERRVRASRLVGRKTIPAEIRVLSDEEALELAVIENLQRSEVPPMEEALAYRKLAELKNFDVATLCAKFAKSEKYIRGRLALNDLVSDFRELLSVEVINVAMAMELSKFSAEIQQEIYSEHFAKEEGHYNSWRTYGVKQLAKAISRKYTSDLKQFGFDKKDCQNCPFNSSLFSLFGEDLEQGNCSRRSCLDDKNTQYMFSLAKQLIDEDPRRILCFTYNANETVNEMLNEAGYLVTEKGDFRSYPRSPKAPVIVQGDDSGSGDAEMEEYQEGLQSHQDRMAEFMELLEQGKIVECVEIGFSQISLGYVHQSRNTKSNDPQAEVERLKYKDKRNKEIAREKIVADTKGLVHKAIYKDGFSDLEEQAIYYLMLSSLKKDHFFEFGVKQAYYLDEKDRLKISGKLTEEKKTLIRRDFLASYLTEQTGTGLELLLKFARQHMPDELAEIEKGHNEFYDKRHKRLEERIKALEGLKPKK